jgi:ABC-type multidrug transport system permease subunit
MPKLNFLVFALAALVPLIIGFVWYSPKVFGKAWMDANGFTEEKMKAGINMPLILGLTYVCGFFMAMVLTFLTIHQWGVFSSLAGDPSLQVDGTPLNSYYLDFMSKYGHTFRTFKHGAFHSFIAGLLFVTPLITINGLFERRSFKYIAIHAGYWIVCLTIMGGIVCQFS